MRDDQGSECDADDTEVVPPMRRPAAFKLWQRDFWDTQMRDREHYDEKLAYVRMNPVRKGLVATPEEWPYQGVVHPIKGSHDDTSDYTCTG